MKTQDEAIIYAICEGEIRNERIWVEKKYERTLYVTVGGFEVEGLRGTKAVEWLEERISDWEDELEQYTKPYAIDVLAREVIPMVKGAPTEIIGDNWIYCRQIDDMMVYYIPFSDTLIFRMNRNDYIVIGTKLCWEMGASSFNVYAAIAKVLAADEKQHLGSILYAHCCRNMEDVDSRTCNEITGILERALGTGEKEKIIQEACRLMK